VQEVIDGRPDAFECIGTVDALERLIGHPAATNHHYILSVAPPRAARTVLDRGGNVAVVFRRHLPAHWHGVPLIDGDDTDLRFLDPEGVVVDLRAKGSAKYDTTGFVVDPVGTPARRLKLVVR
jgi:hypothetical protein